jgi:hypothetical protein
MIDIERVGIAGEVRADEREHHEQRDRHSTDDGAALCHEAVHNWSISRADQPIPQRRRSRGLQK